MKFKEMLTNKLLVYGTLGVLLIMLLGGAGYLYLSNNRQSESSFQPVQKQAEVTDLGDGDLAAKVGALVDVPAGEIPVIASVTDADKVKSTPFLAQAENGDRILVYQSVKKAILYRPSTGKIIEIAPVSDSNSGEASASASQMPSEVVKVGIKNGTAVKGLASSTKSKVEGVNPSVKVVSTGNASRADYEKTLVFAVDKAKGGLASEIAKVLNGEVVEELPQGEVVKDEQILIILGQL